MRHVKCVVWDLDNTVWRGTLLEKDDLQVQRDVLELIEQLDRRGILHSVASKGDERAGLEALDRFGLSEVFLHPQVSWSAKSASLERIAGALDLSLDTFAFVDDSRFELDEVRFSLPQVRCLHVSDLAGLLDRPDFRPPESPDAPLRRHRYLAAARRKEAEESFTGPKHAFLASLDMRLTVAPAGEDDLARAEELTYRTTQLNTTGRTYSRDELEALRSSERHAVLVARLEDRHGDHGTIGVVLLERDEEAWNIRLLLMSCRVLSTGAGTAVLSLLMHQAHAGGAIVRADFVPNDRNRMMLMSYRLAGFELEQEQDDGVVLRHDLDRLPAMPTYMTIDACDATTMWSAAVSR
jgi:FkbH-like protein